VPLGLFLELKKPHKQFCEFLFVFGLKLHEELNFNEGLDLRISFVKNKKRTKRMSSRKRTLEFVV
jgi:hypothetical protein